MEREAGAGFRMGNTCKSMTDSCQCMALHTYNVNHYNIVISLQLIKINGKNKPFKNYLFLAKLGLHCCVAFLQFPRVGAALCCCACASHCSGLSWALGHSGFSSRGSQALEHRLSSCVAPA